MDAAGTISTFAGNGQYGNGGDGGPLAGFTAVSGSIAHSLAPRSDGTVRSWGLNMSGELGDGTTTDRRCR